MQDTSFFGQIRSLDVERNADAPIGGVASGLARKWNVDPLLVRAGFIALTFAGGAGAMLYALAWAFLPDEHTGEIHAQEVTRGNVTGGFVGATALLITAVVLFTGLSFTSTLGLVVTVIIGAVCYNAFRKNRGFSNNDDDIPATAILPAAATASQPDAEVPLSGNVHHKSSAREDPYVQHERARKERERNEARTRREEMRARRRLSGRTVAAVLAVALLSIAGFLLLLEVTNSSVHQLPATIAFTALVLGAIVLVLGIFGRRGGVLSFFAIVAMACATPVMFINAQSYSNSASLRYQDWKPTSVSEVGTGYSITMSSALIDFSQFVQGDAADPISVSVSMSNLDLLFGEDQKVAILAESNLSSVETDVPYLEGSDLGDRPYSIYYETDPSWENNTDDDDWEEQWEAHSNAYAMRDSLQGNDSGTIFLGGIDDVSDADLVINLETSMSSVRIKQQVDGYPSDDASSTETPEPSATPTVGE